MWWKCYLANLDLDGLQVELVRELSKTGTKVIVVLIQGRPHSIGNILDFSDAYYVHGIQERWEEKQ